jgi:predicted phage tail protein
MTIEYPLVKLRIACPILSDEFGEEHYAHIQTPKDIISFMESNFPGFKKRLIELDEEGFNFKLITPFRPDGIGEDELLDIGLIGNEIVLHTVIQAQGAFGRVLLGVALVAAAAAIPFGAVGGGMSLGLLGGSLILGGINQWLTPRPKQPKETPKSTAFNQTTGVAASDAPIPLLLGELRYTTIPVLSSSLDIVRI